MRRVEKHIVCLWGLSELVSLYMLMNFCGGGTTFRYGGQNVHMRKDRGMLFWGGCTVKTLMCMLC